MRTREEVSRFEWGGSLITLREHNSECYPSKLFTVLPSDEPQDFFFQKKKNKPTS